MKKLLAGIACAAALCSPGASQANVLTFDDPGLIVIDMNNVATYTESGFALTGDAASFLPLDSALVGGIDGPSTLLTLMSVGGGAFSLASLDFAFYDLGFGDAPGVLSVTGLLNGAPVSLQTFTLGAPSSASFGSAFANLTAVTFSGTTAFALDNLSAVPSAAPVPEPSTLGLTAVGLLGLLARVNRKRKQMPGDAGSGSKSPRYSRD